MRRGVDYAALAGIRRGGSDSDGSVDEDDDAGSRQQPLRPQQPSVTETPLAKALTALGLARSGGVNDPKKVRKNCAAAMRPVS